VDARRGRSSCVVAGNEWCAARLMSRVHIPAELRLLVLERAQGGCEYCFVHQEDTPFSHQVDHLISLKHGGQTVSVNLALACLDYNRYKGSDLAVLQVE
jgi:5-methylcytosine-specific restriction endonuclease McrA